MTDFELIVKEFCIPMESELICDELCDWDINQDGGSWCCRNCGKTNSGKYPEMNCYKEWVRMKREGETHQYGANCMNVVKKIVQEVAEEYNVGWIPCSERLPEERDWCLAVFEEVDTGFIGIPYIAEYLMGNHTIATTEDGWIIHNCTDIENEYAEYYKKLRCVAWQPLPEPYKAEREEIKK